MFLPESGWGERPGAARPKSLRSLRLVGQGVVPRCRRTWPRRLADSRSNAPRTAGNTGRRMEARRRCRRGRTPRWRPSPCRARNNSGTPRNTALASTFLGRRRAPSLLGDARRPGRSPGKPSRFAIQRPTRCGYGISRVVARGSSSVMDDTVARAPGTDTKGSLALDSTSPASRQPSSSHPAPREHDASAGSPANSRRRGRQHYSMRRPTSGGGCRLHGLRTFSRRRQRRTLDGSSDTARHVRRGGRGRRPRSTRTPPSR